MQSYKSDQKTDNLFKIISELKSLSEIRNFFRDLCTLEEIKNMSDRWETVKMLAKNTPYRDIADKLLLSTTTVSRVAFWLNSGTGGYKSALAKLNAKKSGVHHHNSSSGRGLR